MQNQPHSDEAEKYLLGSLLFCGREFENVVGLLIGEDFFDLRHEAIFLAMESLNKRTERIDMVTVGAEMRRSGTIGKLEQVGFEAYLAELANEVTGADGLLEHARIIREKSLLRRVMFESDRIRALAASDMRTAAEVVDAAQSAMLLIGDLTPRKDPKPFSQVLHTSLTTLQERARKRSAVTGVPSGIYDLDEHTGGFQPGHLVVIAGRPGSGKSGADCASCTS